MIKVGLFVLLLVFVVSLAANSALLGPYYFHTDDYYQFDKTIEQWFAARGIWRLVGTLFPSWLVAHGIYGITAISAHAIGGYFFFLVAQRALGSVIYALFLTMMMMAFPWGYQALVWASAASYALASCLFWAIVWALLSFHTHGRQAYALAAGLVVASFLGLLVHEALFFALCAAGLVVFTRPDAWRHWRSAAVVSIAPLIGALLWGLIYELTKPEVPVFSVGHINLPSALSSLFYQYRSLGVFEVWTNESLRSHTLSTMEPTAVILTLLALCAVPLLVGATLRGSHISNQEAEHEAKHRDVNPIAFLICMIVLCVGAGSIYALAGGYSLDSRKRYIIMPLLIMTAGTVMWLTGSLQRPRSFAPRGSSVALSAICVVGCVTSLSLTSLWKNEMKRLDMLADLIMQHRIFGDLRVDLNPNLNTIWPASVAEWGFDAGRALNETLQGRGYEQVLLTPLSTQRVTWAKDEQRWLYSSAETVGAANADADFLSRNASLDRHNDEPTN